MNARTTAVDALLAAAVTGVVSVAIATTEQASARPIGVAYAFAGGFGLLMFARRSRPTLVVAVSCIGLVAYYASGLPRIGLAVPVAAALFSAAEAGRLWAAAGGALALLLFTYEYRIHAGQDARVLLGYELAANVAIVATVIALGDSVRSRRRLVAERDEVIRRRAAATEADARRQAADERIRIARDLHDAVGHTVIALSLHASAALEALDAHDEAAARTSMVNVRTAAGNTMRELRAGLGLLRQPAGRRDDVAGGLGDAGPLLDVLEAAGVRVDIAVDGPAPAGDPPRPGGLTELRVLATDLPAEVDRTAYRIVQEATTNALRHADPRTLELHLRRTPAALELRVRNDGVTAGAAPYVPGHGLAGMRERAEALGGTLRTSRDAREFLVVATLPCGSR